ncbi:L7Ae/L30e/S12e/Gadd45 family ribosomal protein [Bacilliculturomica massiliensis]|uniref:L7Ae/L30e/S12e/Gadd45 family ribosomal protein n=1 Tax=Bacilliculturomica massiliensis TaxID=1917867 RepID=UPI0013EF5523|nr:ribosomal L7Ae/L30e/S12e/Gadd45 family protein [Bacilliculturomica massiliensis]
MKNKIHSYLGFAKKSRNLVTGYNTCIYGLQKRRIRLLIVAEDTADNTKKKFQNLTEAAGVPFRIYGVKEELSASTGEQDKGVYGVTDAQFAAVIQKEIDAME